MAVYVDRMFRPYRRMLMCHLVADDLADLHWMADAIGVNRSHFQNTRYPHYDICKAKRELAFGLGAIEVSRRELSTVLRRIKR